MSLGDDNQPYVTVNEILGKHYPVLMDYDSRTDEYMVAKTLRGRSSKDNAMSDAADWAKANGWEIR